MIDNADALGNATVQLAKQALDPTDAGRRATSTLGIVTTGGGASVEVGPTGSPAQVAAGLERSHLLGMSATWDGLTRAAELLEDRSSRAASARSCSFAASPETLTRGTRSPPRPSLRSSAAGVRLEVVAMPRAA